MKRVLFVMTAVVGILGISMGIDTPLQKSKVRQSAVPISSSANDVTAQRIAKECISSLKGTKQSKIVNAINEAFERDFWRTKGKQGYYATYSSTVARHVLRIICKSQTSEMKRFRIVAEGIINGRAKNSDSLRLEDFTELGIHREGLTEIGIWGK